MPKLLWVDDDGPQRFRYEEAVLREDTWDVSWAANVLDAVESLRSIAFDAVLLDQMLPLRRESPAGEADYWGACRLLYWLRTGEVPAQVPSTPNWRETFKSARPLPANIPVAVCVVSAFDDPAVRKALRHVSASLSILPKPIDIDALQRFLTPVRACGEP